MSVYAVRSKLYTGAITSATGSSGTLVANLESRSAELVAPYRMRHFRTGWGAMDGVRSIRVAGGLANRLVLSLRGTDSASLALAFRGMQPTGGGIGQTGAGAAKPMESDAGVSIILRPVDASDWYLYVKAATLTEDSEARLLYADDRSLIDGLELELTCNKAANDTEPAWYIGTAARLAAVYAGLS